MEYIALALSLVAVILCIVILTKVNKLLTMLRTPIFKKLTPDMNLKPSARRPISAQEMAQRGERNNKENRQNKERPNNNKDNRNQQSAHQPATRDRNEQRPERGPRRERRPERQHREAPAEAPAEQAAPAAPVAEAPVAEARRPLAPRIPVETPAAPAVEAAPVAPVVEAPAEAPAETVFDPSKVRYGRRNVIKKAPELSEDEA